MCVGNMSVFFFFLFIVLIRRIGLAKTCVVETIRVNFQYYRNVFCLCFVLILSECFVFFFFWLYFVLCC